MSSNERTSKQFEIFGRAMFNEIADCVLEGCFDCDAERLLDLAVCAGLMEYVEYNPDKHGDNFSDEIEPGDMIYFWDKNEDKGTQI